jgi:ABC-type lipoprotein export system ATPase subunit
VNEETTIEQLCKLPVGANFLRADLHIHSYGASVDVRDATMTPAAIVATAAKEGLSLLAITDHNEISGSVAASEAAKGSSVCVIPGVELSTQQCHLLCYLPTVEALKRFHAQLDIVEKGTDKARCQQSVIDCLNLLSKADGFAILAHVDSAAGFERENPGGSPHKYDVICHPALAAIELKKAESDVSYSDLDVNGDRSKMGRQRIEKLKLGARQFLARVLNSDAHTLDALGRNAVSAQRVTRYKMETASFDGLRVALDDADARVRIEDEVPLRIPQIVGLKIEGGFLAGEAVHFSRNLNCIIGGRGTGKSTMFEAVRCVANGTSESSVVDSDVWPDELHIVVEDKAGQRHSMSRLKEGELTNEDEPNLGPVSFEIDCFGQGDAARISIEAQTNPLALLDYLDKFIDLKSARAAEDTIRDQLLDLQTKIEEAETKVNSIPQYKLLLETTKQQLTALKKPEVKELIELEQQLATERELRKQLVAKLQQAKIDLGKGTIGSCVSEIEGLADEAKLTVGRDEFVAIRAGAKALGVDVQAAETKLKTQLATFEGIVAAQMRIWKNKDLEAQKRVDAKRRELEQLKVSFDMSYITKLAKDEASHTESVRALNLWKPHLDKLKKQREDALVNRWAARERVADIRDGFGRLATRTLRESLSDLQVSLKYNRSAYSTEAMDYIEVMGWKTNQQPRAAWLVERLTVPKLLDAIARNDTAPILALKTPEGVAIFREEAKTILERLSSPQARYRLERVHLHDFPRLTVSRPVPGQARPLTREFSKLSLGQQQSVLLALMLSANTDKPLIIDQPEDNLDGEFIYQTLVPVLRRAKERRQVIAVTHNANVAVLGDAELIVVMKAMNDHGNIVARGSIDNVSTREAACAILEGATEAFLRRAKMYGLPLQT